MQLLLSIQRRRRNVKDALEACTCRLLYIVLCFTRLKDTHFRGGHHACIEASHFLVRRQANALENERDAADGGDDRDADSTGSWLINDDEEADTRMTGEEIPFMCLCDALLSSQG